jgi:hypothetical protein
VRVLTHTVRVVLSPREYKLALICWIKHDADAFVNEENESQIFQSKMLGKGL